jgi:hypothetical protein
MLLHSHRFSTLAVAFRKWSDRVAKGVLAALCVVLAIFLGGQAIEFVWLELVHAAGQITVVTDVKCYIVNRTLHSRHVPPYLKAHELGIRYRTGCAE